MMIALYRAARPGCYMFAYLTWIHKCANSSNPAGWQRSWTNWDLMPCTNDFVIITLNLYTSYCKQTLSALSTCCPPVRRPVATGNAWHAKPKLQKPLHAPARHSLHKHGGSRNKKAIHVPYDSDDFDFVWIYHDLSGVHYIIPMHALVAFRSISTLRFLKTWNRFWD